MEKVIFDMPSDPEMFLAALSAVQSWRVEQELQIEHTLTQINKVEKDNETAYRQRVYPFGKYALLSNQVDKHRKDTDNRRHDISVHLPNASFDLFRPAFGKVTFVDEYNPECGDWDLAYQFTEEKAWAIAEATEKHVAIAMGLLLGAESKSLPDLSGITFEEPKDYHVNVLFLDHGDTWLFIDEYMRRNRPEVTYDWYFKIDQLADADMVVGHRSAPTYIASALGKKVVELYPDDKYKRWLSKWDNPNYSMIYGKEFPASMIWRSMETLWERPTQAIDRTPRTILSPRNAMGGLSAGMVKGV